MKKFLFVIVPLAIIMMAIVAVLTSIANRFEFRMYEDYNLKEKGVLIRYMGKRSWIKTPPGWDPCEGIVSHIDWREEYEVYFVPGSEREAQAQLYDRRTSKLLATTTVLWYSSEPYSCPGDNGSAEATKSTYFVYDILGVSLGDIPIGGYPYDETYDRYPVLLTDTINEYRQSLPNAGNWDVIYIPQQERIVLLLDGRIIATGKITKP